MTEEQKARLAAATARLLKVRGGATRVNNITHMRGLLPSLAELKLYPADAWSPVAMKHMVYMVSV